METSRAARLQLVRAGGRLLDLVWKKLGPIEKRKTPGRECWVATEGRRAAPEGATTSMREWGPTHPVMWLVAIEVNLNDGVIQGNPAHSWIRRSI